MSGHNKWSKIKHKKGAEDAKRSKAFSKVIKDITVAVKEGNSGDPSFNPRLRLAISNAKGVNMPKDTILRSVKKALDSDSGNYDETTFEGYGPGGVAVFVECTTDNNNRTVASVRAIFNKRNGNLATTGSVDFLFERKGEFVINTEGLDPEDTELELIDGGAEDIEIDTDSNEMYVTVQFEDFGNMQKKLEDLNIEPKSAELVRIPTTYTTLPLDTAKKVLSLVETLEEDDDVSYVFHNLEMTPEIEESLSE